MKRITREESCSVVSTKRCRVSSERLLIEIIQSILEYSDFLTQIRLTTLSKEYGSKLCIKKVCITRDSEEFFCAKVFGQTKYRNLMSLILFRSTPLLQYHQVDDVNICKNLQVLYSRSCLGEKFMSNLKNIRFLRLGFQGEVKKIPIMVDNLPELVFLRVGTTFVYNLENLDNVPKLKCLVLESGCAVKNLKKFKNLEYLKIQENHIEEIKEITSIRALDIHHYYQGEQSIDINHLKNLEFLKINSLNTKTRVEGMSQLTQLRFLDLADSTYLPDFSLFKSLESLDVSSTSIRNKNIKALNPETLKHLYISNINITIDLNHLINLTYLDVSYSEIKDEDISALKNMKVLDISNSEVTSVNHMRLLETLVAEGRHCKLDGLGICWLEKLTALDVSENYSINNLNSNPELKILIARETEIQDEGISSLVNLVSLDIHGNNNITNVNHMINLEYLNVSRLVDRKKLTKLKAFSSSILEHGSDEDEVVDTFRVIEDPTSTEKKFGKMPKHMLGGDIKEDIWTKIKFNFIEQACRPYCPSVIDIESLRVLFSDNLLE